MTHIQPVQQYTKQGPSARRKRLDCWDEDYAVHRSCKKNVKRSSWRRAYNMEAEIQIFARLRDLKGVMNGKWRTYSAKHSTINMMLSHVHLILQGVSNMPRAWPMVFAVTIGKMPWSKPSPGASFKTDDGLPPTWPDLTYCHLSKLGWAFPNGHLYEHLKDDVSKSLWSANARTSIRINMLKAFEDHLLSTCARFHRRNITKTTCWKHRNSTIDLNPVEFTTRFHWFSSWIVLSKAINHHQLPPRHVWGSPAAHVGCHSPQHFRQLFPGHRPGTKKWWGTRPRACFSRWWSDSPFLVANICLTYFVWNRGHRILFDMSTAA